MLQPSPPTPSVWYRNDSLRPSAPVQTKTENQGQPKRKFVERKALRTAALLNNTDNSKTKRPQQVDLFQRQTPQNSLNKRKPSKATENPTSMLKEETCHSLKTKETYTHALQTEDEKTQGSLPQETGNTRLHP